MRKLQHPAIHVVTAVVVFGASCTVGAADNGTAYGDLRLRYEGVQQDNNGAEDASALTLRTRLGYHSKELNNWSAIIEFEDSRVVAGVGDYKDTLGQGGQYSVIADPETSELDQFLVQYKKSGFSAKLGRQVLTQDNHRFVGHVGWRQDRQTFDGVSVNYTGIDKLAVNYGYLTQRNRIFGQGKDIESSDHLLNISYKISLGKVTGYSYMLEQDITQSNAMDTFGLRFSGSAGGKNINYLYSVEYAIQDTKVGDVSFDANYLLLEGGVVFEGITAKLGYEVLGSDEGLYGFSTPLATLHKFNGWADSFLATPQQGLVDTYLTLGGKVANGKWSLTYHDFGSDESSGSFDDLGSEFDVAYQRKFYKRYNAGIKYASYSAGDATFNKVDTDKVWLWVGASF